MTVLPPIAVHPDGRVVAGVIELRPSRRDWKRRRCHWSAWDPAGHCLAAGQLTPRLALLAALRNRDQVLTGLFTVTPIAAQPPPR